MSPSEGTILVALTGREKSDWFMDSSSAALERSRLGLSLILFHLSLLFVVVVQCNGPEYKSWKIIFFNWSKHEKIWLLGHLPMASLYLIWKNGPWPELLDGLKCHSSKLITIEAWKLSLLASWYMYGTWIAIPCCVVIGSKSLHCGTNDAEAVKEQGCICFQPSDLLYHHSRSCIFFFFFFLQKDDFITRIPSQFACRPWC